MAKDRDRRYQTPEQLVRDLLIVAGALGLRSLSPEGLVWMTATPPPAWERHLVWGIPALAFSLVVATLTWWGQDEPTPTTLPDAPSKWTASPAKPIAARTPRPAVAGERVRGLRDSEARTGRRGPSLPARHLRDCGRGPAVGPDLGASRIRGDPGRGRSLYPRRRANRSPDSRALPPAGPDDQGRTGGPPGPPGRPRAGWLGDLGAGRPRRAGGPPDPGGPRIRGRVGGRAMPTRSGRKTPS